MHEALKIKLLDVESCVQDVQKTIRTNQLLVLSHLIEATYIWGRVKVVFTLLKLIPHRSRLVYVSLAHLFTTFAEVLLRLPALNLWKIPYIYSFELYCLLSFPSLIYFYILFYFIYFCLFIDLCVNVCMYLFIFIFDAFCTASHRQTLL